MEALTAKLQPLLLKMLSQAHSRTAWTVGTDGHLDEDERVDALADATDILLERVDMAIDQSKTLRSQPKMALAHRLETAVGAAGAAAAAVAAAAAGPTPRRQARLMHAQNIQRPQLSFPDPIDNSEATVFVPKLKAKPNATVLDLKASLVRPSDRTKSSAEDGDGDGDGDDGNSSTEKGGGGAASDNTISPGMSQYIKTLGIRPKRGDLLQYPHPYGSELHAWEPSDEMCTAPAEQMYGPVGETPLSWVETEEQLAVMAEKLDAADIFAIDLEAHNYRTYASFTCLMQISTRTEDFVVDTLSLRGSLHVLNSSFTNPKVAKVLHGADSDIMWLQKDLGLYLVGMFDTGQAAQVLAFPRKSLAHLLKHYCSVTVDKAYQLADWRIRPLGAEMLNYAREDTHYLLYVYDRMRADLLAKGNAQANLLRAVWDRSRDVCLQRYEKSVYDASMATALYNKNSRSLSSRQLSVFKALHAWRDEVSRQEDESIRYVLPDHQLFELADVQPREIPQVLACCKPVPPMVRIHAHTIIQVISSATMDVTDSPAKKARKTEEDDLISNDAAAAAAAAAAIAAKKKRVPISELLLPPVVHNTTASLVATFLESSCVARSFSTATVLESTKPEATVKAEHAASTFAKESLLAQLFSTQATQSAAGVADGQGQEEDVDGASAADAGGPAVSFGAPPSAAAVAAEAAAEAAADAEAAAAAEQAAKPAGVVGTGDDGILRLSRMKRAGSSSKRKRDKKKEGQGGGGGSNTSTPKKNVAAKTLNDGVTTLSKTALKKKRKKEAAAKAAAEKQPAAAGSSFNPYGM